LRSVYTIAALTVVFLVLFSGVRCFPFVLLVSFYLSQQHPIDDLIESAPRFREWFNHVSPETEKLPLDWRELDKTFFHKLLPIRALRPDRMLMALEMLQKQVLPNATEFLNLDAQLNSYQILEQIYEDSDPTTPIYFVLSPGVNWPSQTT
jgi:hypothetical protein